MREDEEDEEQDKPSVMRGDRGRGVEEERGWEDTREEEDQTKLAAET